MKRGWFVLLALSLGLNAGLLYVQLSSRDEVPDRHARQGMMREGPGPVGPMGHPDGPPGFIRDRLGRVGDRLNLSEDQIEGMSEILKAVMPELLEGRETIRGLRAEMREEYLRPQVDARRIQELRRETVKAQSQLDSIMVETMLEEAKLLTPEQREAYFDLMPLGERGKHGAGMRRGHGRSERKPGVDRQ
jgi:Spy/CpxP family protein refolding chaperone